MYRVGNANMIEPVSTSASMTSIRRTCSLGRLPLRSANTSSKFSTRIRVTTRPKFSSSTSSRIMLSAIELLLRNHLIQIQYNPADCRPRGSLCRRNAFGQRRRIGRVAGGQVPRLGIRCAEPRELLAEHDKERGRLVGIRQSTRAAAEGNSKPLHVGLAAFVEDFECQRPCGFEKQRLIQRRQGLQRRV